MKLEDLMKQPAYQQQKEEADKIQKDENDLIFGSNLIEPNWDLVYPANLENHNNRRSYSNLDKDLFEKLTTHTDFEGSVLHKSLQSLEEEIENEIRKGLDNEFEKFIPNTDVHPKMRERLNHYYETATPEQIINEFQEMGVEFEDVIEEYGLEENDLKEQESLNSEIPEYIRFDPEIVGYPDNEMQEQIYEWTIEGLNLIGKSVLDVGAGRGDLFSQLQFASNYVGFETKGLLCEIGKQKYGHDQRFNLLNSDYLETELTVKCDVGFVIGTLNSLTVDNKWETFLQFFQKMYADCNDVVIFIINSKSEDGFNEFPFLDLFTNVLTDGKKPFKIDYSKFEDVYRLSVYK